MVLIVYNHAVAMKQTPTCGCKETEKKFRRSAPQKEDDFVESLNRSNPGIEISRG